MYHPRAAVFPVLLEPTDFFGEDRKSTRLNSSHTVISYAVFCLKKKTSSAVCSLFVAEGALHPNRQMRIWWIFPVNLKWLLVGFSVLILLGTVETTCGGIVRTA